MSARTGVKNVAKFTSKVINKLADSVADVIESLGHLPGDGLTWAGKKFRMPESSCAGSER